MAGGRRHRVTSPRTVKEHLVVMSGNLKGCLKPEVLAKGMLR